MKLFALIGVVVVFVAIYYVAKYLWGLHQDRLAQNEIEDNPSAPPTTGVREPSGGSPMHPRGAEEEVYPVSDRVPTAP